ncbi:hypothetical protein PHLCEN_2v2780 [Hermanssonia centrifuga]|uniref:Uncharacterized protein n=1 Tax=Hermanssonia centrifuga TaxID=98765 RepID=A0A2R6RHY6_9APHY|nr:hypothetical protein PHLCEN_2v2780 [Hermanssonia centrifuga]
MESTASTVHETTSTVQPPDSSTTSAPEGTTSLIAPTVEPPPHKSTKIEATQLKDPEVKDFGWNSPPNAVPSPLIHGLPNDDIYTIVRRFNKVRLTPPMFVVLILDPPSRKLLFPPAPLALISGKTGNLQVPKAGTLGSKDSLSGAPEAHKGEAVEQEARHFVSGIASMAVSTAAGKGPGEDGNGNAIAGGEAEAQGTSKPATAIEGVVPDPTSATKGITEAKDLASGDVSTKDPAKKPVEDAMWDKARPIMRAINETADMWERLGNALSPVSPFELWLPRLRLAGPLAPLILVTYFIPAALFIRVMTFISGLVFFGRPLLTKAAHWLTQKVHNWRDYLDLRKTLLYGVPTNAQLTLTLLRIAEAKKAPLPPPPSSEEPTASDSNDETESFDGSTYDVDTDSEDYANTSHPDAGGYHTDDSSSHKKNPGRKIAAALKRTVKAGVGGALGVDHLKAKIGSESAKQRLGAVDEPPPALQGESSPPGSPGERPVARSNLPGGEGPCVFSARMHGKKGNVVVVNSATSPCVAFAYTKLSKSFINSLLPGHDEADDKELELKPEFTIGINSISELRKMGGFGWKGKMVVGWALRRQVLDGLEIKDRDGKSIVLTAIKGRDELFNRLVAMNGQKWEIW